MAARGQDAVEGSVGTAADDGERDSRDTVEVSVSRDDGEACVGTATDIGERDSREAVEVADLPAADDGDFSDLTCV